MPRRFRAFAFLFCSAYLCGAQVTIIDTGSTNVPGMNIKLSGSGPEAMVEQRDGSKQKLQLSQEICDRLMADLKAAGPLNELPVKHCMKSVSFGKSIFVEYNGVRSPDLSCPQYDGRAVALKNDATAILALAKPHARAKAY